MTLTSTQKRRLRALAHPLKPIVTVGTAGLSTTVIEEIDRSLAHHELIKIRIHAGDRTTKADMAKTLCQKTHSESVQMIGHILIVYRQGKQATIILPHN